MTLDVPTVVAGLAASVVMAQVDASGITGANAMPILIVLWGLAGLAAAANVIIQLWRNVTGRFAERPPSQHPFVTTSECREMHAATDNRLRARDTDLDTRLRELDKVAEQRMSKVHSRLDVVVTTLHELKGTMDNHIREHHRGQP
jgi:hypothetical protein